MTLAVFRPCGQRETALSSASFWTREPAQGTFAKDQFLEAERSCSIALASMHSAGIQFFGFATQSVVEAWPNEDLPNAATNELVERYRTS